MMILKCGIPVGLYCVLFILGSAIAAGPEGQESRLALESGSVSIDLDTDAMREAGISLQRSPARHKGSTIALKVDGPASSFQLSRRDGRSEGLYGTLATRGGADWTLHTGDESQKASVGDFLIGFGGRYATISDSRDIHMGVLEMVPETMSVEYDPSFSYLMIRGEVRLAEQFMMGIFGTDRHIGSVVGRIIIEGSVSPAVTISEMENGGERAAGPDVTVGELRGDQDNSSSQPRSWGVSGAYAGYSVGTTSCNVGTMPLNWYTSGAATPDDHPVINQALYRYSVVNGASRIEMLGQAWLKHGFCALQGTVCGSCSPYCGGCCDHLGVGCSDPYTAQRNGGRGGMGPKAQINPSTGQVLVWPYPTAPTDDVTTGRLRVLVSDVNPANNPGAIYYAEGQYVAEDDAAAGNKNNNASYRRCQFGSASPHTMTWFSTANGQTIRQVQAIKTWAVHDTAVSFVNADVDGRYTLGYRVTDLSGIGNGPWHYEYVVHNMNSDRGAASFVVPCPSEVTVSNTGFRDVDYYRDGYDGDGGAFNYTAYDGTNWPVTTGGGVVSWNMVVATPPENSNALRWGTSYNFRFDANSPPTAGTISMELFKSGSPHGIEFAAQVPSAIPCGCPGDLNASLTVDGDDVGPFTAMYLGQSGISSCADLALPNGGPLDDADINEFVDLLINGTNTCK